MLQMLAGLRQGDEAGDLRVAGPRQERLPILTSKGLTNE